MFGLSKQEKFRKEYYAFLSDLFGMRIERLLAHYPGIKDACKADAAKSEFGPQECATFTARAVIVDNISKQSVERREKINIEYNQINWNEFYVWFLDSRIQQTTPPQQFEKLTLLIAHAQCGVLYSFKLGQIDEMAFEDFRRDIAGALEGLSEKERIMERLRSAADITTIELGMDPDKFRPPM